MRLNGENAIKIMAANHYGLDKLTWQERIQWFDRNRLGMIRHVHDSIRFNIPKEAEKPILLTKALIAYTDAREGKATGYMCELDATASGIQIMAALSGCMNTAYEVNMVEPDERKDLYNRVAELMEAILGYHIDRNKVKKPVMTHYYNSKKTPQMYLNEEELIAFYQVLENNFEGAEQVMTAINNCWDETALYHQWTLPDGHVARCKTMTHKHGEYYVPEFDTTLDYVYWINEGNSNFRSLAPNVIHSIDGYVAREMVRRAKALGFQLCHIHDCFMFHPNYFENVTQMYRDILREIAESNLLQDILSEITDTSYHIKKSTNALPGLIAKSSYMLS